MKKNIKLSRAKSLQKSISLFTEGNNIDINGDFELLNDDGSKHLQSDVFVKAVHSLKTNKAIIFNILNL